MSFSDNWGHLKNNMAKLRQKIDQKQRAAKNISSGKLNLAARNRKRISLVRQRNKEMITVRLITLILIGTAIGLIYYLNH